MSYQSTKEVIGVLNHKLQARYDEGDPLWLDVSGRPNIHVVSFSPIAYEKYGFLRNRAPNVAGSLALRAFLLAPHPEGGAIIYAGVASGSEGYGFVMDGHDDSAREVVTSVANILGHPNFRLTPS